MSSSNFHIDETLWSVRITEYFGKDTNIMFDDIIRMVLIQITIQLMFYMSCEDRAFFTEEFFLLLLYIILGILLYWLVFKKAIKFV
jgi:heme/copper-type cytochrome/quinol oxidase subunit 4